jgi:hypothetical protein
MGMFDYLKISTEKLPLSPDEKRAVGENHEWQTKDFDCILSTAEITDDGKLRFFSFKYAWDEDAVSPMTKITGRKGGLIRVDEEWIDVPHHGYVRFYGSANNVWYEFMAKFTEGVLVNITVLKDHR